MKKILYNLLTIVAATTLTITSFAQMANNSDLVIASNYKINKKSNEKNEKTIKNLPVGLDSRVSIATDQPVEWLKSQYGYTASYMLGETNVMATYDNESRYIETYKKIDWNSSEVSSVVKSALLTSGFKDQEVLGYWESSDPTEYGYYLELKDETGNHLSIWVDDKGNFYDRPYDYTMKTLDGTE
jgi:c-di-AMP phosphodiesterase-like protein